ncbi:U4/U6-U5 snRNP complex subunit SPP381 LALA0_S10e05292g [Lachancea lanzarotensis]|uniref:LALA0S10e05292g1_1 n=1 Tax=Lachancea lanzarotensis TaxID=1245769 RepID=A0A0C7NET9_9SACH|nr:uncharacterized protein LALA0_S10e05292g [Lachancea lanzarotensis]CEP64222.1 LALA0S10e05292g1_1 [Lachancea lanzarotensis]
MAIRHFRRRDIPEEVASSSSESSGDEQPEDQSDEHTDEHTDEHNDEHNDEHDNAHNQRKLHEKEFQTGPVSVQSSHNPGISSPEVGVGSGSTESAARFVIPEETSDSPGNNSDDQKVEGSDETEESSSSDDEYVLHKPVFLKRPQGKTGNVSTASVRALNTDKDVLLAKIQEDHKRVDKNKELISLRKDNITSNQDLLANILALDDDDSQEPDKEHLLWEERQKQRALRQRRLEEKKQAELEDYESAKLANASVFDSESIERANKPTKSALKTNPAILNASSSTVLHNSEAEKRKADQQRHKVKKSRKYNPQPLRRTEAKLQSGPFQAQAQDEQNEYSVI